MMTIRTWATRLPYVMMAYRSSVTETTGYTPNMMMHCREVTVTLNILFAYPIPTSIFSNMQYRMEHAHEIAREYIQAECIDRKDTIKNKL